MQSIHRLIDQKAQLERDSLSHSQPVEIVTKQRSYIVTTVSSEYSLTRAAQFNFNMRWSLSMSCLLQPAKRLLQ